MNLGPERIVNLGGGCVMTTNSRDPAFCPNPNWPGDTVLSEKKQAPVTVSFSTTTLDHNGKKIDGRNFKGPLSETPEFVPNFKSPLISSSNISDGHECHSEPVRVRAQVPQFKFTFDSDSDDSSVFLLRDRNVSSSKGAAAQSQGLGEFNIMQALEELGPSGPALGLAAEAAIEREETAAPARGGSEPVAGNNSQAAPGRDGSAMFDVRIVVFLLVFLGGFVAYFALRRSRGEESHSCERGFDDEDSEDYGKNWRGNDDHLPGDIV